MICSLAQLCQHGTEFGYYFSLGIYTTFKLTITQLDPLEFEILYDEGTFLPRAEARRYVAFQDLTIIISVWQCLSTVTNHFNTEVYRAAEIEIQNILQK